MADDMDADALTEELTIQQVILDSLEGETFDGVEEEKRVARDDIQRLKRLLRAAKHKHNVHEPHSQHQDDDQPRDQATPGPSSDAGVFGNPTAMSTPPRSTDLWSAPGSYTLPSRKRDADAADLLTHLGHNKSLRTTPVPSSIADPFYPSSSHSNMSRNTVEVIDLTGDDDELTADFIAAQIKDEKRREQEREDSELAWLLSDRDSAPFQSSEPSASEVNAFTRLMGSQLPASGSFKTEQQDSRNQPETQPEAQPVMPIPGAYNPTWDDDPFHSRPIPQAVVTNPFARDNEIVPANPQASFNTPFTPTPLPATHVAHHHQSLNGQHMALGNVPFGYPSSWRGQPPPSFSRPNMPILGNPTVLGSSGRNTSALSDIINRTSGYDFVNGTDALGNALPEGLTDFLHDAFHDPGMTAKELDDLLQNISPDMDIPERNRDGTPAGLKRPLYPHQELALTWMKKMEDGTNKGGILADDMGLGKTISTLALILSRPATSRPKTNLIVGPVALIKQWEEEIITKTKLSHRLSVFVYHGKRATTEDLLRYDVVLTTYGTIAQELKKLEKLNEENSDRNIDFNDKAVAIKCPLLHPTKAKFYRIILDEAQCIKNKNTKTAQACSKLKATYRWCLTGTPMMNGVLELYSLLNFLRIKPYSKWDEFRQAFGVLFGRNGDPRSIAMSRLRALLKAIMLRRKKNSQLDGKPILKLPEKTEQVVYAKLSSEEQDFYNQLEKKSQVQFSKYLREGSIGKNYSNILVLLLRLRQACCHPHLNLDVDDVNTLSDEDKLELVKGLSKSIVDRIKDKEAFECPICYDVVQCPSFFIPCGHDSCNECLVRLTENATTQNLQEGNESSKAKCPVCRGQFDPAKCFTYDAFQKVHMAEQVEKTESEQEEDSSDEEDSEFDFGSDDEVDKKGNLKGFIVDDEFSDDDIMKKPVLKAKKSKKNGKKKASDIKPSMLKTLRKEAYKNREAFKKYMRYLRKTWLPAAKVTECMNLIQKIGETGEKTIVFSQWTLLLDLLEVAMWHEKMAKPVRYDGSMTATERNIAAHKFRDNKDVKVMLVSLRAGNAGLNLTAASRVIIMDPFWNPYIEMQAVDRAYRIGQQKEVNVYRILTRDTVEDRIVELQKKKKDIVEAALDEAESVKIGRLNVNELRFLFNSR